MSNRIEAEGRITLEGAFLVERAEEAGLAIEELFCVPSREEWACGILGGRAAPRVLPEAEISRFAGYPFHRGALAFAKRPQPASPPEFLPLVGQSTVLVLPEIGDPENLGAAFRNASAFGCSAIFLGPTGPDPLCRRALRVSMGAVLTLPWTRLEGPEELAAVAEGYSYKTAACVLDPKASDLRSWKRPERLALVFGNEAFGISGPWLESCGDRITLPMLGGTDSLNLAAAAAVFLYALR
jgi:tRNA G18 (ribose-2'-O)-methylase SpoU